MSRWSDRIPGVAASQRAYTTYLNRLRADSFDQMAKAWSEGGRITDAQGEAISNFINVATGRGSVGGKDNSLANALAGMNTVFFAPRLVLSRFQLLLGQPMWKGTMQTRMAIAGEYARFLAGVGVLYTLAMAAGADVEIDPRSSDFGKIIVANTRLDPLAGISQSAVLLARVASGESKTLRGGIVPLRGDAVPFGRGDTASVIGRFMRTKFSPAFGTGIDIVTGRDVIGQKITIASMPERLLIPLAFGDVLDAMEMQDIPTASALAILAIFGMNLYTVDYSKRNR